MCLCITESSEFEKQWESVFGEFEQSTPTNAEDLSLNDNLFGDLMQSKTNEKPSVTSPSSGYMPSQLLDLMAIQGTVIDNVHYKFLFFVLVPCNDGFFTALNGACIRDYCSLVIGDRKWFLIS